MADFISALYGRQMDEALLDVAEHNSEAWAVGTRNGVEVQEGDITFQNNSQYYAQLAASQITGDITDAVRWDTDQSTILTDEAKARARNNINAAPYNDVATNLNLLDNPCWKSAEVVNQRGVTSWSGIVASKYTVDRWRLTSESLGNSVTLGSNGLTFSIQDGYPASILFMQYIDNFNVISGLTVTCSVKLSNGTIYSGSGSGSASFYHDSGLHFGITSSGYFYVELYTEQGGQSSVTYTIQSVKLELGSYSTLANDTPPDKGVELAKCIASTADPNDPYANSGYARSNRNLLDNPFFTVNQRNFTSVSATNNVYSVDRWKINNGGGTGGSISKTSAGYMQLTTGSTYISLQQMFGANELAGKTVTMSINDNGTIYTHSFVVPARSASDQSVLFNYKTGCNCNFFIMNSSAAYGYIFQLSIGTGYSATIRAVKLELGSYSTLINDVPPDYGEELRKCKQYYRVINCTSRGRLFIGIGFGSNGVEVPNVFGVGNEMRISTPDVASTGTFYVNAGSDIAVTSVTKNTTNTELSLSFNVASGVTAHQMYSIIGTSGAKIEFKADL